MLQQSGRKGQNVSRPSNMTKIPLTITHPKIAQEWNSEKTGALRPEDIDAGGKVGKKNR